jgi:chromosome segregation ATPase
METFSKIRTFFETFKKLTFWQRLFYFSAIRVLSFEAWEELTQLNELVKRSSEEKITARSESQLLQQERNALQRQVDEARQNLSKVELQLLGRITKLELELKHTTDLLRDKENKLQRFQQTLGQRETEHQSRLDKATDIHDIF